MTASSSGWRGAIAPARRVADSSAWPSEACHSRRLLEDLHDARIGTEHRGEIAYELAQPRAAAHGRRPGAHEMLQLTQPLGDVARILPLGVEALHLDDLWQDQGIVHMKQVAGGG